MVAARATGNRIRLTVFPGLLQGASMPDKKEDEVQQTSQESASKCGSSRRSRRFLLLFGILIALVAAAACMYAIRPPLVGQLLLTLNSYRAPEQPTAALSQPRSSELFSTGKVLGSVGKSLAQPGDGPALTLEGLGASESGGEADLRPTGPTGDAFGEDKVSGEFLPGQAQVADEPSASPQMIETPVIVPRSPPSESPAGVLGSGRTDSLSSAPLIKDEVDTQGKSQEVLKRRPAVELPGERKKAASIKGEASHRSDVPGEGEESSKNTGEKQGPSQAGEAKSQRFELPGSLTIAIKDYEGSVVKWGLMVILDDSVVMGKKSKTWSPTRSAVAASLVTKLPEILTPGSRLAVRDFMCSEKRDRGNCLSHLLFDWADAPYKDLTEKLKKLGPAGRTDPCAAAAYAVKKDMSGLGQLARRLLIVTSGWTKCNPREVLQALGQHKPKEDIAIDVVGLGIPRKTFLGYATLVRRSNGFFMKADNPGEVERILAQYKKRLNRRAMEKVEVRGDRAVLTVNPGEEITLAPGTYSVVLPLVASLKAAKRTISDVKIRSGETTEIEVKIRKGRPIVKIAKK